MAQHLAAQRLQLCAENRLRLFFDDRQRGRRKAFRVIIHRKKSHLQKPRLRLEAVFLPQPLRRGVFKPPAKQILHQPFLKLPLVLPAASAQVFHLTAQTPAAAAALAQLAHRLHQFLPVDGFEQIVPHAVADRALRVFKVRIAADDDDFKRRFEPLGPLNQLQAMAAGHADVGDQDIRAACLNQLKRLKAI